MTLNDKTKQIIGIVVHAAAEVVRVAGISGDSTIAFALKILQFAFPYQPMVRSASPHSAALPTVAEYEAVVGQLGNDRPEM